MTDKNISQVIAPEELERLHELVTVVELQLNNIGDHHPQIFGQALLSLATFVVEKVYHCSSSIDAARAILDSAQDAGLQSWIEVNERIRTAADEPKIITLDG